MNFDSVPAHYETIYDSIPNLERTEVGIDNREGTIYACHESVECPHLNKDEKTTIDYVFDRLRLMSTSMIMEVSRWEKCWQNNSSEHSLISYDEAFDLKFL